MLDRILSAPKRGRTTRLWVRSRGRPGGPKASVKHLVGRGLALGLMRRSSGRSTSHEEAGTVAWPGDLDLAPDALHRRLSGATSSRHLSLGRTRPASSPGWWTVWVSCFRLDLGATRGNQRFPTVRPSTNPEGVVREARGSHHEARSRIANPLARARAARGFAARLKLENSGF